MASYKNAKDVLPRDLLEALQRPFSEGCDMFPFRGIDHPLASGRTADVYSWDDGAVLKLFRPGVSMLDVELERRSASAAFSAGIPTPAVYGMIRHRRRIGLIFDRVDGPTLLHKIRAKPEAMDDWAKLLADFHLALHRYRDVPGLLRQRERLAARMARCRSLPRREREAVLDALTQLPDGDSVCHGDFHPDNILLTPTGPVLIDWVDAASGNPMADVARTSLLILGHIEHELVDRTQRTAFERFHDVYLQRYMAAVPERRAEYEKWLTVMAAARLAEGIAEQHDWLLHRVRTGLDMT